MVSREDEQLLAGLGGHNRAAVTYVGDVAVLLHDEHDDGAGARLVMASGLVRDLDELLFSGEAAVGEGLRRVLREAVLIDDDLVEVVFEEVSALAPAVAVVDREEGALGPEGQVLLRGGPSHVENDRHPVFIVVPLDALVRVCRVGHNESVGLRGILRFVEVLQGVGPLSCWVLPALAGLPQLQLVIEGAARARDQRLRVI